MSANYGTGHSSPRVLLSCRRTSQSRCLLNGRKEAFGGEILSRRFPIGRLQPRFDPDVEMKHVFSDLRIYTIRAQGRFTDGRWRS